MNKCDFSNQTLENVYFEDKPALVDVAVLMLFFNRPEQLAKVFEKVRLARPSKLFLYQDGKRDGNLNDEKNVQLCREVVSNIDWGCEVHRLYQKKNFGCDPLEYISQKWAFSEVDKCIVLEDDDVPDVSFFQFCKEMLDKYENDTRIYRISGLNILEQYSPYHSDYFFTKAGSIWGCASWKRVVDEWDPEYQFLDDSQIVETYKYTYKDAGVPTKRFLNTCTWHKKSGKEYYESIYSACRYMNSGLTIVPSKNMISNIGISAESTHGAKDIRLLTKSGRSVFNMQTYEMKFPLKHPKYILEDKRYEDLQSKRMGWRRNFFQKVWVHIEESVREILFSK